MYKCLCELTENYGVFSFSDTLLLMPHKYIVLVCICNINNLIKILDYKETLYIQHKSLGTYQIQTTCSNKSRQKVKSHSRNLLCPEESHATQEVASLTKN